ncbi:AlpA family phage regulatory protein [uncultured Tolumonas sp.]|uniref:helix-turn-helix transcriptional regulator n=1 Tax=uncultured Tolumonas sp. TaxID=263765 RepID=UPI002A0A381E|nr:AlpA family phage regulatory protein [uncultured Tolumonas sp.]
MNIPNSPKIIRIKDVATMIGVAKSTIYDWTNSKSPRYDPTFPKSIKLGANSVGWMQHQLIAWIESKL